MVVHWWDKLPDKFETVELDQYVLMPNHFHGIIILRPPTTVWANPRVRPDLCRPKMPGRHTGPPLPQVVQWFKTMTTNAYIHGVNLHNWPPFPGKLWQRDYYERIIRDENDLDNIRRYIRDNPAQWVADNENPANHPPIKPPPNGRSL